MPQFSDYTPIPFKQDFGAGIPSATPPILPKAQPADSLTRLFELAGNSLPDYAKPKVAKLNTPVLTELDKTLRYTDPELGFNPQDYQLEYKYADAHPWKTLGNNLGQFGARFLGAGTEAILTIPIAVNAIAAGDFSKLHDNPVTNTINGWINDLNIYLPTYRTQYEEQHPLLKYLNPFELKSFGGAWGGAINNLGYTAGAIAGAIVEDAAITAATGGVGFLPALGANVLQLKRAFTTAGKMAVAAPQEAKALLAISYPEGIQATKMLAETTETGLRAIPEVTTGAKALMRTDQLVSAGMAEGEAIGAMATTGGGAMIRGEGTGLYQSAGDIDKLMNAKNAYAKRVDFRNTMYKIGDGVKYNLALLTSAAAEGAFEAAEVREKGIQELSDRYREVYGSNPYGEDLQKIKEQAKTAANFTMGANIALLYLSNRVNWGSLFKPTNQALTEGITGWGKNIARTGTKMEWQAIKNEAGETVGQRIMHSVVNTTPETRIGKILLNGEKILGVGGRNINEAVEEGAQFLVSESSLDYIKRKYDPYNLKQVGDYMKSFNEGLGKTFGTNEGWDNIIGGFIGGILGGGVMHAVQKPVPLNKQLADQKDLLNTSTFADVMQGKISENAIGAGLAEEHKNAVVKGDTYRAKNLKFDMLYNWVTSGLKANNYEKRLEELNMAQDLQGKSFKEYWGVEDTEQNRQAVNTFLESTKSKAENIKSNYEKVERITKNPHKKQTPDWYAFEDYKNELALNLSRYTEYQRRLNSVKNDMLKLAPLLDIETAVNMTSVQGISGILQKIQKTSIDLAEQIKQAEGNEELQKDILVKKQALDGIFTKLQPIVYSGKQEPGSMRVTDVQFNGEDYVGAMRDLYNLLNGVDLTNNKYIEQQKRIADGKTIFINQPEEATQDMSDDDFAEALQSLQDIYKLSDASYNIGKYYTYLRKGLGQTEFTRKIREIIDNAKKHVDEAGEIKTAETIEDEIRQEEYEDIDPGDTNVQERQILKRSAKKTVYDEPLTKEEQDVTDKYEEVFTDYVKAEQRTKKRTVKEFENVTKTATTPEEVITESTKNFKGTNPNHLFFSLFRNEKYLTGVLDNLHDLIFNTHLNEIGDKFIARIKPRPEGERKITPFNGYNGIYRLDNDVVIEIYNGDKIIGELRPPQNLFLDENGTIPLIDANGKLNITAENYEKYTGNDITTFEEFKSGAEEYFKAYTALYNKAETGDVDSDFIKNLFNFSINPGTTIQNSKNHRASDTLVKDVKIKNKAVVSIKKQADGTFEAEILQNFNLTQEEIEKIKEFVRNNNEFFIDNGFANKMVGVFPVGGEVLQQSFVRARFITDKERKVYGNNTKVTTTPDVFDNFTINFIPKPFSATRQQASAKTQAQPTKTTEEKQTTEVEKTVGTTTYVKNKTALIGIIKDFFGLTEEQAKASAELFDAQVKAWAKRNPGKKASDYYKEIGFGTKALFEERFGQTPTENIQFSKEEQIKLQKEKEELRNILTYPTGKTNLGEEDWYTTQTPTFKAWFGNSTVVDENGEPLVQYHWSPEVNITEFNLAGIGTHFGTKQAADEVNGYKNGGEMEFIDNETGETVKITIPKEEGRYYKVFIRMQNPLDIEDVGQHRLGYYINSIKDAFTAKGITLTEEDLAPFKVHDNNYTGEKTKDLNTLLNKYGFDGMRYINNIEDEGSTSYIVTNKANVKLTEATEFNLNKGDIRYQQRTFAEKVQAITNGEKNGGFNLIAKYSMGGKMFAGYVPKSGKATPILAKAVKDWVKKSNITGVEVTYNPNTASIYFKNVEPKQTTLFQKNTESIKQYLQSNDLLKKECK